MQAQFLNEIDLQHVRLSSEVMFLSQVVEQQQVEIAKLNDEIKVLKEINTDQRKAKK